MGGLKVLMSLFGIVVLATFASSALYRPVSFLLFLFRFFSCFPFLFSFFFFFFGKWSHRMNQMINIENAKKSLNPWSIYEMGFEKL